MFYDSPLYFCLLVNFRVLSSFIFGVLIFLFTSNVVLGKDFTEAAEKIAPFLKFIFNQSLTTGQVTGDRKCASVSPVFKKGSELKTLATTNQYHLLLWHVGLWHILSSIILWVTWMRIMYLSIRPHLEYACSVWDPHTKKNIQSIEKVQRRAARFVKKCNQRTPGTITSLLGS